MKPCDLRSQAGDGVTHSAMCRDCGHRLNRHGMCDHLCADCRLGLPVDDTDAAVERLLALHDGDESYRLVWDLQPRHTVAEHDARALAQLEHRRVE